MQNMFGSSFYLYIFVEQLSNKTIKIFTMNTMYVTSAELEKVLFNTQIVKGMANFANVVQATEPKCTKKCRVSGKPNPYKQILKVSNVGIILNTEYVKAVTNQLKREDKPETDYKQGQNTMPLEFGENNQIIGKFNGKAVLQYRPNDNTKPETMYLADGKQVTKAEIEGYLPKQQPATNQGTEREILWRKLYLTNVLELSFNNTKYVVIR